MELARQSLALFAEHRLGTSTLGLIASDCQICILRKVCSCVHCSAEYKLKRQSKGPGYAFCPAKKAAATVLFGDELIILLTSV